MTVGGAGATACVSTTSSPSPPVYEIVNGVLPIVSEAPSGKAVEGPDDRDGALDDRELLTVRRREAKRGVETHPPRLTWPVTLSWL